jgi:hypothetical protein
MSTKIGCSPPQSPTAQVRRLAAASADRIEAKRPRHVLLKLHAIDFMLGLSQQPEHYDNPHELFPIHLDKAEHARRAALDPEEQLAMAVRRLGQMHFVGVTNRYNDTACLWAFTFRRPGLRFVEFSRHELSPEERMGDRAFEGQLDAEVEAM